MLFYTNRSIQFCMYVKFQDRNGSFVCVCSVIKLEVKSFFLCVKLVSNQKWKTLLRVFICQK
jgi:hypothetical protein